MHSGRSQELGHIYGHKALLEGGHKGYPKLKVKRKCNYMLHKDHCKVRLLSTQCSKPHTPNHLKLDTVDMAEVWGQFGNPEYGECLTLEAVTT
jgi:hypothetical protein